MAVKFIILAFLTAKIAADNAYTLIKTMYVNEGDRFTLPCKNETPGIYYGVVWKTKIELFMHLVRTGYNIHERIVHRSRLVHGYALQIDNAVKEDVGTYECNLIFFPKLGERPRVVLGSYITLVVFVKPNITSMSPAVQYQSIGRKATITCAFQGYPYSNITWTFDGGRDLKGKYVTENNTSILRIKRLKKRNTGYYTCIAYNRAGRTEKKAFIKVKYAPRILYYTQNPHIDVDRSGTITCRARGYPVPGIFWLIKRSNPVLDLSLDEEHRDSKFSVSSTRKNLADESAEGTLTIKSVTVDDWKMNITCIASNDQGSVVETVNIKGFDKPKPPELTRLEMFTNKALLHWSVPKDGGSKVLAYILQYRNSSEQGWIAREIRPANIQSFQIMELIPDTIYSFRIASKNEVGTSEFSDVFRAATKDQPEPRDDNFGKLEPSKKGQKGEKGKSSAFGDFSITALVAIIAGVFLFMMLVCIAVFCLFRKVQKSASSQTASVLGSRPVSVENGSLMPSESRRPSEMPSDTAEFIPLLTRVDHWEFPRDRLRLSTVLGSGAFGMVMRGDAQGIKGFSGSVKVAVKIAKDTENVYARKDLHAELDVLKLLPEHQNVIGLLGCCTRNEPLMIIVEYCAHGDLQGFLRNSRGISESYYKATYHPSGLKMTSNMLLTFAVQIATGMSHLSAFKVIHRDLAARNILVDENLVCKISDFGFARDVYIEEQYMKKSKGGRFPIKWMAIESLLDGISTSKSDVWAFGVVLWEIVTLGASPYPGMNSYEVVSFLQDGYRMDKPKHCSDELYAVSMNCWHLTPQRRPAFDELAEMLKQMLNDEKEYINMNFYQDHLYENFDVNLASHSAANTSAIELNSTERTPLGEACALEPTPETTS